MTAQFLPNLTTQFAQYVKTKCVDLFDLWSTPNIHAQESSSLGSPKNLPIYEPKSKESLPNIFKRLELLLTFYKKIISNDILSVKTQLIVSQMLSTISSFSDLIAEEIRHVLLVGQVYLLSFDHLSTIEGFHWVL